MIQATSLFKKKQSKMVHIQIFGRSTPRGDDFFQVLSGLVAYYLHKIDMKSLQDIQWYIRYTNTVDISTSSLVEDGY